MITFVIGMIFVSLSASEANSGFIDPLLKIGLNGEKTTTVMGLPDSEHKDFIRSIRGIYTSKSSKNLVIPRSISGELILSSKSIIASTLSIMKMRVLTGKVSY